VGIDSVVVIDGISSLLPLGSEVLSDGETFYIATAEIDSFAGGGGAFRLGFPAGGFTVLADSMSSVLIDSIGSQVVAVDSNRVQIISFFTVAFVGPDEPLVYPSPSRVDAPVDSALSVSFAEPLNPASVDTSTFSVRSNYRGRLFGSAGVTVSSDSLMATLALDSLLMPNEVLSVTLTDGMGSSAGNVLQPFVWQFTGAVSPSSPGVLDLVFHPLDEDPFDAPEVELGDVDGDGF